MANEDWSQREIDQGNEAVDREIERLKRVYRQHAEALSSLAGSAPTKALSRKYRELISDIERSILGLEDPGAIVSRSTGERPVDPAVVVPPPAPERPPSISRQNVSRSASPSDVKLRTEPGIYQARGPTQDNPLGRIALILVMAIIVMGLLAFFVWKYGGDAKGGEPAPTGSSAAQASSQPAAAVDAIPAPAISASPEAQDFGVVYKGTRVAKAFEIFNNTERDVTIEIERSECRCLWFDYPRTIAAGSKVTLSIAVDGARAEKGLVSEAVVISTKDQPRVATEIQVTAEIR